MVSFRRRIPREWGCFSHQTGSFLRVELCHLLQKEAPEIEGCRGWGLGPGLLFSDTGELGVSFRSLSLYPSGP